MAFASAAGQCAYKLCSREIAPYDERSGKSEKTETWKEGSAVVPVTTQPPQLLVVKETSDVQSM